MDIKERLIGKRLSSVRRILAVVSGKGGVGKTIVATCLALAGAERGQKVGFLDLDFTNPNAHVVLGLDVRRIKPEEEKGVIPPEVHGVRFMSMAFYADKALALRGISVEESFKEVLAITIWPPTDLLIVDMPPGFGDQLLNLLTYVRRVRGLAVTTPDPLSLLALERLFELPFREVLAGVVENMSGGSPSVRELCEKEGVRYLGAIPYVPKLYKAYGEPRKLLEGEFGRCIRAIWERVWETWR